MTEREQSLDWVKDEQYWISIKDAARYEGMSVTEYYEYLYKLDKAGFPWLARCDIDRKIELYIGARFEEFGTYYRLTPDAYRRWQREREEQERIVAELKRTLQQLGMNTRGLPRPQDFKIHSNLVTEN